MNKLALVVTILLAGCAATNVRTSNLDPRIVQLEDKRKALEASEQQCIDQASASNDDAVTQIIGTPEASVGSQTQKSGDHRDREIARCHMWADHQNALIAEQERKQYEHQAQEEAARNLFLSVVTAPSP
jgi:hypothetical protein